MPDLPAMEYLHELWVKAGRCSQTISGAASLGWSEIDAFNRLSGANLSPVEAETIRLMSEAFAAELHDKNPLRIAPVEKL